MHLLVVSEGGSLRFRRSYSLAPATPAITKRIVLFLPLTSGSLIECENAHLLHEGASPDLMHECNASSLSSSATVVFSVGAGQYMVNLPRVRG
jgi:hypothetical protein